MTTTGAAVDFTAAVGALASARSVTVLCHIQPDADTLGSGLALAAVLDRRGVPVQVSFAEPAEPAAAMAATTLVSRKSRREARVVMVDSLAGIG